MFEHLLKIRYLAVVIVILAVLHAVAFLVAGSEQAVEAYRGVVEHVTRGTESRPGIKLMESLDLLFLSMVHIVLALGVAKLFLLDPAGLGTRSLPAWLQIESIGDLKLLLWETILTTLLIIGLSEVTAAGLFAKPDWTILMMPLAILVLALSLYFMRKGA